MNQFTLAFAATALAFSATAASAAVGLVTTQTNDAAFEGPGGFLQTYYGLPLVGGTALPPIERAVGQVKTGFNKRRGLYTPTAATGIPGVGAGVTQALTNVPPVAGGSDANFATGTSVNFVFSRTGNTVRYVVGSDSWSETQNYFADINGIEFRIRSNTQSDANAHSINDVLFSDTTVINQSLGSISAADGAVLITLWEGIVGDFTLTGNYTFNWGGSQPTGARLASQIKLLDLPPPVPEPATWAMLIAGFGLVGSAMRRRRTAIA